MKSKFYVFLLMIFACFGAAEARNLSLDEAVGLVLAESQDIKKAAANIGKMQSVLDGVNAGRWFKMDATASYTNLIGLDDRDWWGSGIIPNSMTGMPAGFKMPTDMGTVGLAVTQPIYTFGKIGYALDMARAGLRIADVSKKLAEIETGAAAVQLYWSAKMTDELVKIAEKSLKNTRNAQRQLTATGRANRSNLVKISADVAAREVDLSDAEFNRDSAHRMLKVYAGIDEGERLVLTSNFPDKFDDVRAKEISPYEWDIYEQQAKMYDAEKWQNYTGYLPTLAAFGNYDYNTFGDKASELTDMYRHSANVGVALSIPLFDGGSKRALATGSAMSAIAAREDLDKSKKHKTAEYNDLIQKHGHLKKNLVDLLRAKELAEKAYHLSRDRFLAGQTSATELADVERQQAGTEAAVFGTKLSILATEENIRKFER